MIAQSLLLLGVLASAAFGEPIPQGAAATTSFDASSPSFAAFPSYNSASEAALLSQASVLESIVSDIPTLPASIESVLATAVPISELTATDFACEAVTATPDWYKSLPADVKTALSSYEKEIQSWYSEHSAQLGSFTASITAPVCTGGSGGGVAATTASTKGGATATGASATGSAATGTGSGSATAAGTAASSKSTGAAARPTGAVAAGAAGLVGMLGLIVAL